MKKTVFRLLCSNIIGKILSLIFCYNIPNIRNNFKRFATPKNYTNNTVRAMIFWGFYESAEMRLIKQFLPKNLPVVELGASLGIVSSTVNELINLDTDYIGIEANPYLIETIKSNIKKYCSTKKNYTIINAAVAYNNAKTIQMNISNNNTESSLVKNEQLKTSNAVEVSTIKVGDIINKPFTLICDIEGAEIEIFKNDTAALQHCQHLFIELHQTSYENKNYSVGDLQNIITSQLGFKLFKADGNVFYYTK